MSQTKVEKYEDPRTGGREVKEPKIDKVYVARLIQHGGRVHLGIPRKVAEKLNWLRGELVILKIDGHKLRLERYLYPDRPRKERRA